MAQQEGWPLGLQPMVLNARRIELGRNGNNSGSVSFNTLATASSPSSSTQDSSSALDTESTGSFFLDNSTTLGSLMGVSSIVELSRKSLRGSKPDRALFKIKKDPKSKFNFISWLFCLIGPKSRNNNNNNNHELGEKQKSTNIAPLVSSSSLGEYLAVERRIQNPLIYGHDDEVALAEADVVGDQPNSLFVNGTIAPPTNSIGRTERESINGFGSLTKLFSCVCGCGQATTLG